MDWKPGMKVVHRAQRGVGRGRRRPGRRTRAGAWRSASPAATGVTVVSGRDPALAEVPADTPIEPVAAGGALDALAAGQPGPATAFAPPHAHRAARGAAARRLASARSSPRASTSCRTRWAPRGASSRTACPRFVLADEVGLGKTVEAGLVFAGLRQLGIAERVLVVVPEHLAFQWLAELFHKFNALFTLLSPGADRGARRRRGGARALARSRSSRSSALRDDPELAAAAADVAARPPRRGRGAPPRRGRRSTRAIAPICRGSFGLLLLTATPVRLDPARVLPAPRASSSRCPSTSLDAFLAPPRAARGLRRGGARAPRRRRPRADAPPRSAALAPDDPVVRREDAPPSRARAPRPPRRPLQPLVAPHPQPARQGRRVHRRACSAARTSARASKPRRAASRCCARLAKAGEKVLVFGHDLEALRDAAGGARAAPASRRSSTTTPPSLEARDRLVARFRDPEGPMVLLSGESGGEGRNFQFASHLVCADLPDSPLVARAAHRPARPARPAPAGRDPRRRRAGRRRSSPTCTST